MLEPIRPIARFGPLAILFSAGLVAAPVAGQPAATQPATQPATTQPATTQPAGTALSAVVRKVSGTVVYAAPGKPGTWKPVRVGDRLASGTRIRTLFRSSVILTFAESTVVQINPLTSTRITAALVAPAEEKIRIDLQYGEVRAGVAERQVRTDLTIRSPNATLARRGTEGISFFSERFTGRFRIALAGEGLIEVIDQATGGRRSVLPSQYVTEQMVNWIETAKFDRAVTLAPTAGLTSDELAFVVDHDGGRGVVSPAAGSAITKLAGGSAGNTATRALGVSSGGGAGLTPTALDDLIDAGGRPKRRRNEEGNFGFGGAVSVDSFLPFGVGDSDRRIATDRRRRGRAWLRRIGRSRVSPR